MSRSVRTSLIGLAVVAGLLSTTLVFSEPMRAPASSTLPLAASPGAPASIAAPSRVEPVYPMVRLPTVVVTASVRDVGE